MIPREALRECAGLDGVRKRHIYMQFEWYRGFCIKQIRLKLFEANFLFYLPREV